MRALFAVALLVGLVGCAVPEPVPEDRFYRLAPPRAERSFQGPLLQGVVVVHALDAAGVHRERAVLFSPDRGQRILQQYNYDFWLDAPPQLVRRFLIAHWRQRGLGATVLDTSPAPPDYVIAGRLERFEQLAPGAGSAVVVAMELRLERRGGEDNLLIREDYEVSVPAGSSGLEDAVPAFERALESIAESFARDVASVVSPGDEGGRMRRPG
jgi:ABC-type uncharacterized transport system auxiliary subunit